MSQDRRIHRVLFKSVEGGLAFRWPTKLGPLALQDIERLCSLWTFWHWWYHPTMSRNHSRDFLLVGTGTFWTACIFSSSTWTPSQDTQCPRNVRQVQKNLLFFTFEACLPELVRDCLDILKVLLPGVRIVYYIIQVHKASFPKCNPHRIWVFLAAGEAHAKDEGCFPTFCPDAPLTPFVLVVKKVRILFYLHFISQKYWVLFEQTSASYFGDTDFIIVLQHLSKPLFHFSFQVWALSCIFDM